MDPNSLFKGVKSGAIGLKRAVERGAYEVMGSVGLSNSLEADPQYESALSTYSQQTDTIRALRSDAVSAFDAIRRSSETAIALATRLDGAVSPRDGDARLAVEALMDAQRTIDQDVLPRVERRVKKRVVAPADEELERAKEVSARVQSRKRSLIDLQRYRQRESEEERRKARDKAADIQVATEEIITLMRLAIPRRSVLIKRTVAETVEFQRRFYLDSARLMERAVEAVGQDSLAALRGTTDEPDVSRANNVHAFEDDLLQQPQPRPQRRPSHASPPPQMEPPSHPAPVPQPSHARTSNGASIWDEDDDGDDDNDHHLDPSAHPMHENPFDDPPIQHEFKNSTRRPPDDASSSYPSAGVGKRESARSYPSSGVGSRESVSSYPTGASRQRESVYPTSKPASRPRPASAAPATGTARQSAGVPKQSRRNRSDAEADLLNFDDTETVRASSRGRKPGMPPAAASVEDLLDLGGGGTSRPKTATAPTEGDLLGDFGDVQAPPTKSSSTNPPRSRGPSPSMPTSSSAPTMRQAQPTAPPKASVGAGGNLEREQLRKMHEAEIKARADEKLAAVREREKAEEKERDQKDNARGAAEARVNQWTGNGTRRGNLRALLASLDTVLYPGATWKPVTMQVLKANPKVKVNYHKAILQVHPDKIGSKNLPPDQQVLAELIFDELKNAYEVWTAEQEGRPPPPGSVGPKGPTNAGGNSGGGFGNMGSMGRSGMYNNMGGMGRGGMGMGGMGMGGMGRGGMGNMPMGGMGRSGMGMGGMGGRGMGGMGGMGGMPARRGSGMGNMPQGFGVGRNTHQRR
eukprot:GFKZ01009709.1.p1 GENE.GFKZ01009709.1~~GFKZ01009709.1.p1  ORF type:complete len:806 (+),score=122.79 GFKZ01009709.1:5275-7692(+)